MSNWNFESNYPLTNERAAKMVAGQQAASRRAEAQARDALALTGGDKLEALKVVLAWGR